MMESLEIQKAWARIGVPFEPPPPPEEDNGDNEDQSGDKAENHEAPPVGEGEDGRDEQPTDKPPTESEQALSKEVADELQGGTLEVEQTAAPADKVDEDPKTQHEAQVEKAVENAPQESAATPGDA